MKTIKLVCVTLVVFAVGHYSVPLFAQSAQDRFHGELRDAWLTGKIETVLLLNKYLSSFAINTDVRNGIVHLTGQVRSAVEKDLATQLVREVYGVETVQNDIQLLEDQQSRATGARGNVAHTPLSPWIATTATIGVNHEQVVGAGQH